MSRKDYIELSKRERQIMDIIHRLGEASVTDVLDRLPKPPTYNSVRMLMNILEKKGHLYHRNEKNKYIYYASLKKEDAKKSALDHLLKNYFEGSAPSIVSTLIEQEKMRPGDLEELQKMIEEAKRKKDDQH